MSYMSHESSVSVRTLQQQLKRVLAQVERGHSLTITRRRRVVARLVPAAQDEQAEPWPDLAARTRAVFGRRRIVPSPSRQLLADRGRR
jgi:prevent-host-death family protein